MGICSLDSLVFHVNSNMRYVRNFPENYLSGKDFESHSSIIF